MRGRPPTRKKGAYTAAERMRRYRRKLKRSQPSAKTLDKQEKRAERERVLGAKQLALPDLKFGVITARQRPRPLMRTRALSRRRAVRTGE